MRYVPVKQRILRKIVVTDGGCWEWTGYRDRQGYGRIRVKRRSVGAHAASYEAFVGPIPEGLELDHLCRNRSCVNPAHLEPVTPLENFDRGESPPAVNKRRDRCVNGHAFDEENTYVYRGGRQCRVCNRAAVARSKARRAAA